MGLNLLATFVASYFQFWLLLLAWFWECVCGSQGMCWRSIPGSVSLIGTSLGWPQACFSQGFPTTTSPTPESAFSAANSVQQSWLAFVLATQLVLRKCRLCRHQMTLVTGPSYFQTYRPLTQAYSTATASSRTICRYQNSLLFWNHFWLQAWSLSFAGWLVRQGRLQCLHSSLGFGFWWRVLLSRTR